MIVVIIPEIEAELGNIEHHYQVDKISSHQKMEQSLRKKDWIVKQSSKLEPVVLFESEMVGNAEGGLVVELNLKENNHTEGCFQKYGEEPGPKGVFSSLMNQIFDVDWRVMEFRSGEVVDSWIDRSES